MHAALRIELVNCLADIAARKLLHDFFERRVFLPYDLVEPRCRTTMPPESLVARNQRVRCHLYEEGASAHAALS